MPKSPLHTPSVQSKTQLEQLRTQLRAARRALTATEQDTAAQQVSERLLALDSLQAAQTIAVYLANDGEVSLAPLIQQLWQQQKQLLLPVIDPQQAGKIHFLPYRPDTIFIKNQYGIAEPNLPLNQAVPLSKIDVMCTPLVGFDSAGQRIGMGGGFYDRLLAPWFAGELPHLQPLGIAHNCQHLEQLPHEHWDIPLPQVVTPAKLWQFSRPTV